MAILFFGVLMTVLLALHMTLFAMARTAVTAAADAGLLAAQGALPGGADAQECGTSFTHPWSHEEVTWDAERHGARECAGVFAAHRAMSANRSMVGDVGPARVQVHDETGVVSVRTHGAIRSPVFGFWEVDGFACGPLDSLLGGGPTPDAGPC